MNVRTKYWELARNEYFVNIFNPIFTCSYKLLQYSDDEDRIRKHRESLFAGCQDI